MASIDAVTCRTSVIEDNPRVPTPEPARPSPVSDESLSKEGTVRIVGGDTPARKASHLCSTRPSAVLGPILGDTAGL